MPFTSFLLCQEEDCGQIIQNGCCSKFCFRFKSVRMNVICHVRECLVQALFCILCLLRTQEENYTHWKSSDNSSPLLKTQVSLMYSTHPLNQLQYFSLFFSEPRYLLSCPTKYMLWSSFDLSEIHVISRLSSEFSRIFCSTSIISYLMSYRLKEFFRHTYTILGLQR